MTCLFHCYKVDHGSGQGTINKDVYLLGNSVTFRKCFAWHHEFVDCLGFMSFISVRSGRFESSPHEHQIIFLLRLR